MPESLAEVLARIKPRLMEDWWEVCLRPDLVVAHEEAKSDLEAAYLEDARRPQTMGTAGPSKKTKTLAKKVQAIEDEMVAASTKFLFRGLPKDEFRDLCAAHPPREGDQYDSYVGYDREVVSDALVRVCLIDPEPSDESWDELVKIMGAGQWNDLRAVAEKVNGSVIHEPPKSRLASEVLSPNANASAPAPASE